MMNSFTTYGGRLLDRGDVDGLDAAFLNEGSFDGDIVGHLLDQHIFGRIMVLYSHQNVQVTFFRKESDGVARFGARDSALFVVGAVIAAFKIAPEINHFAFESYGIAFWFFNGQQTTKRQND